MTYTAVRTKFIDDQIASFALRRRAEDGASAINVGAGFDTRAFSLDAAEQFAAVYDEEQARIDAPKKLLLGELG